MRQLLGHRRPTETHSSPRDGHCAYLDLQARKRNSSLREALSTQPSDRGTPPMGRVTVQRQEGTLNVALAIETHHTYIPKRGAYNVALRGEASSPREEPSSPREALNPPRDRRVQPRREMPSPPREVPRIPRGTPSIPRAMLTSSDIGTHPSRGGAKPPHHRPLQECAYPFKGRRQLFKRGE